MTCQERIECLKNATPAIVTLLISAGAIVALLLIVSGRMAEYAPHMDKLIGTLMVIAGLQNNETN